MDLSFIAIDRIAESQAAMDKAYRAALKRKGKTPLSEAHALSDAELLARLENFDITLDRDSFQSLTTTFLSAEDIHRHLLRNYRQKPGQKELNLDWVWLSLTLLWERWFPDQPSFEKFNDRMQEGYRLQDQDEAAASDCWLKVWSDFLVLLTKSGLQSIGEFDDRFRGTQCTFNWIQDLEMLLGNTALAHPEYHNHRIRFCEEFLERFPGEDALITRNMRQALAESTWRKGDRTGGEAFFEGWLKEDPQWGWGWIGWSDLHHFPCFGTNPDLNKAEAILERGLAVANVRDRDSLLERLADLYEETGRADKAASLRKSEVEASGVEPIGNYQAAPEHAAKRKVGRNEPCPCGSGEKFKRCCGR
jgi:hypothetical protein